MSIKITEDCISCGACEPECPNGAIYEGGAEWSFKDGTTLADAAKHAALADSIYYIVPDKCTECVGFHDSPQCNSVCPVTCCVSDDSHVESKEALAAKKEKLHA